MRIFSGKGFSYCICNQSLPAFCAKHLFENLKYCFTGSGAGSFMFCVLNGRSGSGSVRLQETNSL